MTILDQLLAENYGLLITILCTIGAGMCTIIAIYTRAAIGLAKGWIETNTKQHGVLMAGVSSLQQEVRDVERKAEGSIERHVGSVSRQLGRFATDITDRVSHLEGQVGVKRPESSRKWYEDSNVSAGVK